MRVAIAERHVVDMFVTDIHDREHQIQVSPADADFLMDKREQLVYWQDTVSYSGPGRVTLAKFWAQKGWKAGDCEQQIWDTSKNLYHIFVKVDRLPPGQKALLDKSGTA